MTDTMFGLGRPTPYVTTAQQRAAGALLACLPDHAWAACEEPGDENLSHAWGPEFLGPPATTAFTSSVSPHCGVHTLASETQVLGAQPQMYTIQIPSIAPSIASWVAHQAYVGRSERGERGREGWERRTEVGGWVGGALLRGTPAVGEGRLPGLTIRRWWWCCNISWWDCGALTTCRAAAAAECAQGR